MPRRSEATASLSGKVVLVTGGSRGIGRAIALACAARGARVVAGSRSAADHPGVVAAGTVTDAVLDVTDEASVTALFDWLDGTTGRLDALVNNAGVGVFKRVEDLSLAEWRHVVDTNLTGAFLCTREAVRRMKGAGGGRIVTIGSLADRVALAGCGAYGASKHGARGLTHVVTEEGKEQGVLGTLISIGAVATDVWRGRPGFDLADMLSVEDAAACVVDVLEKPLSVRIDAVELMPRKGIL